VRWCGRELEAEQLLVPEARQLFERLGAGSAFEVALEADWRSKVAAGVGVGVLGLSFTMLIGATPKPPIEGAGGVVFTATSLLVLFGGSVVSFILHGIFSNQAIEALHHAMDVVEQTSARK